MRVRHVAGIGEIAETLRATPVRPRSACFPQAFSLLADSAAPGAE
jgi:hypothetical protein